jgi:hypothetical protein
MKERKNKTIVSSALNKSIKEKKKKKKKTTKSNAMDKNTKK